MARRLTSALLVIALAGPAAAQPRVTDYPAPSPTRAELVQNAKDQVELLEAHLVTRQAHVRASEVAAEAAARDFARVSQLGGAVEKEAVDKAKATLDMAKAQLDIRRAELGEVAVRLRHAKRRADALAAAPLPPAPPAALFEARVQAAKANAEAAKARVEVRKVEYDRVRKLLQQNVVSKAEVATAAAQLQEAEALFQQALAGVKAAEAALDAVKGKPQPEAGKEGAANPPAPAEVVAKRAAVQVAKARLAQAKNEVDRLLEAAKRGIVSADEFAAARLKVAEAEALVRVAEAELAAAEAVAKPAK